MCVVVVLKKVGKKRATLFVAVHYKNHSETGVNLVIIFGGEQM